MGKFLTKILFNIRQGLFFRGRKKTPTENDLKKNPNDGQGEEKPLPKVDGVRIDFETGKITLRITDDRP